MKVAADGTAVSTAPAFGFFRASGGALRVLAAMSFVLSLFVAATNLTSPPAERDELASVDTAADAAQAPVHCDGGVVCSVFVLPPPAGAAFSVTGRGLRVLSLAMPLRRLPPPLVDLPPPRTDA